MAGKARFALRLILALELVRDRLEHADIGFDALRLDRAARRRVVARRGQRDAPAIIDRDDRLHRALAEGSRAEKRRALLILQRARDDLGRRGRAAIDQHDEALALGDVAVMGVPAHGIVRAAPARRDDLALLEEGLAHADSLVEQAARIVAQIEDIALDLLVADILAELAEGAAQIV